jgi:rhodanese-related sulfurtransferase
VKAAGRRSISPEKLLERIDAGHGPTVIDVRAHDEFASGHVPQAIHFPFMQARNRKAVVPASPDEEIVLYCEHGPRAWIAGSMLRRRGFTRITYLTGHMHAWKKRGLRQER